MFYQPYEFLSSLFSALNTLRQHIPLPALAVRHQRRPHLGERDDLAPVAQHHRDRGVEQGLFEGCWVCKEVFSADPLGQMMVKKKDMCTHESNIPNDALIGAFSESWRGTRGALREQTVRCVSGSYVACGSVAR
jgi:hypothetical protein